MIPLKLKNQRGAIAVIAGIIIFMILCFVPLAIDLANLYVAKNELQNAADAGALAGAQDLYNDDGTVNTGANQTAFYTATENLSQKTAVEILNEDGSSWTAGNNLTGDIRRGHWSWGRGTTDAGKVVGFKEDNNTAATELWDVSDGDLDDTPTFINAVKVWARRDATPVVSFFARIFDYEDFKLEAEAVAYIGFSSYITKEGVDQPVAVCEDSILLNNLYSCNIGRMQNATNDTARWTNFTQEPCETASNSSVNPLVCGSGNPDLILFGQGMGTVNGVLQDSLTELKTCWENEAQYDSNGDDVIDEKDALLDTDEDGIPDQPWNLYLPVVDCTGSNTCSTVLGVVNVNVVWITGAGDDPHYNDVPMKMGNWTYDGPVSDIAGRIAAWDSFVTFFNLQNTGGSVAPYEKKSIYFLPDCTPHEGVGGTGGDNYGILAKIPVLVD